MDAHKKIKGKKTAGARIGAVRHDGEAQEQGVRKANQDNGGIKHARPDADYPEYDGDRQYGGGEKKKK